MLQYLLGRRDEGEVEILIGLVRLGDVAGAQHQGVAAELLHEGGLGAVVDRLRGVAGGELSLADQRESSAQA